jgi:hypothetical protein
MSSFFVFDSRFWLFVGLFHGNDPYCGSFFCDLSGQNRRLVDAILASYGMFRDDCLNVLKVCPPFELLMKDKSLSERHFLKRTMGEKTGICP